MMTRSKQHALMFLLGALLVGGVLGFFSSSWYNFRTKAKSPSWAQREGMYDDLALTPQQRQEIDSVTDVATAQMRAVMTPVDHEVDSLRTIYRQTIEGFMTAAQRVKYDERRKEAQERQAKIQAQRDSIARAHGKDPATARGIRPL
jgi:Spy/CpxP family protein refolding chaperone